MQRTFVVSLGILCAIVMGCPVRAADPAPPVPAKTPAAAPAKVDAPAPAKVESAKAAGAALDFLPEIVARYGGDKTVTAAEIKKLLAPSLARAAAQGMQPTQEQIVPYVNQAIQAIVGQHLLKAKCEKEGYKPEVDAAKKRIDELEASAGKEKFEQQLQMQGLTRDELLPLMADGLMIDKWVNEKVKPAIKVDDKAIEAFYNENAERFKTPEQTSASHILIKVDQGATDVQKKEARAKAESILEQLKKGGDFAALAKENSACPSKERGGDLGSFSRGQMVPAFEETAFKLKPGELSGVVETDFGFHIIKGGEHKDAGQVPLAEVKEPLRQNMIKQQVGAAMEKLVSQLWQENKVEVLLPKPPEPPAAPVVEPEKKAEAPAPAKEKTAPEANVPAK